MNKDKVMAMIRKRSVESGVSVNTLLLTYFFERFLVRLSGSTYKTDLILKGGFLLSSIMGIETRTTMDMDMSLRNRYMGAESIRDVVENIISVSSDDEVTYEIRSISSVLSERPLSIAAQNLMWKAFWKESKISALTMAFAGGGKRTAEKMRMLTRSTLMCC